MLAPTTYQHNLLPNAYDLVHGHRRVVGLLIEVVLLLLVASSLPQVLLGGGGAYGQDVLAPALGTADNLTLPAVNAILGVYKYAVSSQSSVVQLTPSATTGASIVQALDAHDQGTTDFTCLPGPSGNAAWREIPVAIFAMEFVLSMNPPPSSPYGFGIPPTMTSQLIAQIYNGDITSWQSNTLAPYNQFVDLPQGDIVLVAVNYSDPQVEAASYIGTFGRALARYDPAVFGAAYTAAGNQLAGALRKLIFPAERLIVIDYHQQQDSGVTIDEAYEVLAAVAHNNGTAAVVPVMWTTSLNKGQIPMSSYYQAGMENLAGVLLTISSSSLQAALIAYQPNISAISSTAGLSVDIGFVQDSNSSGAWPLAGLFFVSIENQPPDTACSYLTNAIDFLKWWVTNPAVAALMEDTYADDDGVASLTGTMAQLALDSIGLIQCLESGTQPSSSTTATIPIISDLVLDGTGDRSTLWYWWGLEYQQQQPQQGTSGGSGVATETIDEASAMGFGGIQFQATSDIQAAESLLTDQVDFGGVFMSDVAKWSNNRTVPGLVNGDDVTVVPVGLRPVSCSGNTGSLDRLILTVDALIGIFLGNITRWNDTALAAPPSYGTDPIRLVLDQRGSPSLSGGPLGGVANQALYYGLASLRPDILGPTGNVTIINNVTGELTWPASSLSTTIYATNDDLPEIVASTPSSFGCDFVDLLFYQRTLRIADIIVATPATTPSESSRRSSTSASGSAASDAAAIGIKTQATLNATTVPVTAQFIIQGTNGSACSGGDNNSSSSSSSSTACWPLGAWVGVAVSTSQVQECARIQSVVAWAWWVVSSPASTASGTMPVATFGADPTGPAGNWGRSNLLSTMSRVTCTGGGGQSALPMYSCLTISGSNTNGTQKNTLCSDHGTCSYKLVASSSSYSSTVNATCQCGPSWTGPLCEELVSVAPGTGEGSSGLGTGPLVGAVVGSAMGMLMLMALILVAVAVAVAVWHRRFSGHWFWNPPRAAWQIDADELEMGELVGSGAMGEVWHGKWHGLDVAIKVLRPDVFTRETFTREVEVGVSINHPHVVRFLCGVVGPPQMMIVTQWMHRGSLRDTLDRLIDPSHMPPSLMLKILRGVALGVQALHRQGIVHGDLTSSNVLIDDRWNASITDFGLSRHLAESRNRSPTTSSSAGGDIIVKPKMRHVDGVAFVSVAWTAPEVLADAATMSMASDIYSLGIIMWELLTHERPYGAMAPAAVAVAVLTRMMRPKIPDHPPMTSSIALTTADKPSSYNTMVGHYTSTMSRCWDEDVSLRPSIQDVCDALELEQGILNAATDTSASSNMSRVQGNNNIDGDDAETLDGGGTDASSVMTVGMGETEYNNKNNAEDDKIRDNETEDEYRQRIQLKRRLRRRRRRHRQRIQNADNIHGNDGTTNVNALVKLPIFMGATRFEAIFVVSDIARSDKLWSGAPLAMARAVVVHNQVLRSCAATFGGTEVADPLLACVGTITMIFSTIESALSWCCRCQEALLTVDWPADLLKVDEAAEHTVGDKDLVVFRGPRVRMGIASGPIGGNGADNNNPRYQTDPAAAAAAVMKGEGGRASCEAAIVADPGQIIMARECVPQKKQDGNNSAEPGCPYRITSIGSRRRLGTAYVEVVPTAPALEARQMDSLGFFDSGKSVASTQSIQKQQPGPSDDSDDEGEKEKDKEDEEEYVYEERLPSDPLARLATGLVCPWVVDFKRSIRIQRQLGTGPTGTTHLALWNGGQQMAYKRFLKQQVPTEADLLSLMTDGARLHQIEPHHNLLVFVGVTLRTPNMGYVAEYVEGGTLLDYIESPRSKVKWTDKLGVLHSVACALEHLHKHGLVHGNLKPTNIMFDVVDDRHVCVGDMGFTRLRGSAAMTTRCDPPVWTAPELLYGGGVGTDVDLYQTMETMDVPRGDSGGEGECREPTPASDVYSLAMIMWQVCMRKRPYEDLNFIQVALAIQQSQRPPIPSSEAVCPKAFANLMQSCWNDDPRKRPTMSQVVARLDDMRIQAHTSIGRSFTQVSHRDEDGDIEMATRPSPRPI